jgi:phenylacetate-coenzyme A ligase PaaK-like adenylate-forming protein
VRYDTGDELEVAGPAREGVGITEFARVVGRCNDFVILPDGAVIHSEVFTHAVRACPEVAAYQVVQAGGDLRIHYLSTVRLSAQREGEIRTRLVKVHPDLAVVCLERVAALERSIAGKTPMVVRRPCP